MIAIRYPIAFQILKAILLFRRERASRDSNRDPGDQ
jgi:hypothetical protein